MRFLMALLHDFGHFLRTGDSMPLRGLLRLIPVSRVPELDSPAFEQGRDAFLCTAEHAYDCPATDLITEHEVLLALRMDAGDAYDCWYPSEAIEANARDDGDTTVHIYLDWHRATSPAAISRYIRGIHPAPTVGRWDVVEAYHAGELDPVKSRWSSDTEGADWRDQHGNLLREDK